MLDKIEETTLTRILMSNELKIKSEDWLYETIWRLVEIDRTNFSLIQFIRFEFVSTSIARRFIADGAGLIDLTDSSIWSSIGCRFIHDISPGKSTRRFVAGDRTFSPTGKSLDGVISYLTVKCGGNVHDKGLIEATSNGVHLSRDAKNAADLQNRGSFFQSNDEPNSWICYDFKDMEVTPSHYSIISVPWGAGQARHPKSWCLEVSRDGQSWTEVHRCDNTHDLNGANQIRTYSVTREVRSRFVRLRQTGKTHYNCDYLMLSGFEVFGILHE
jgi:hypothetical protein